MQSNPFPQYQRKSMERRIVQPMSGVRLGGLGIDFPVYNKPKLVHNRAPGDRALHTIALDVCTSSTFALRRPVLSKQLCYIPCGAASV